MSSHKKDPEEIDLSILDDKEENKYIKEINKKAKIPDVDPKALDDDWEDHLEEGPSKSPKKKKSEMKMDEKSKQK